jgi:hypothetical protein
MSDPARIGGLGLSRGADVLIKVAAEDKGLRAVVSDDYRNLGQEDSVARIAPTPLLLIATGGSLPVERDFNRTLSLLARSKSKFRGM